MRFLIVGAGALGGYYGGMLLKGGADVTFLVRPRRAAQLAERGLTIKEADNTFTSSVRTVQAGTLGVPTMSCSSPARPTTSTARSPISRRRSSPTVRCCRC
jgi:ketopantoate reductase